MKVLIVAKTLQKGGAERTINLLSNYFVNQNIQIAIITCNKAAIAYKFDNSIPINSLLDPVEGKYCKFVKVILECKRLSKYINSNKPDIIISFLPEPSFIAAIIAKKIGIPLICSERRNPELLCARLIPRMIIKYSYLRAKIIVFQTNDALKFFNKKIRKKGIVIPNSVDKAVCNVSYNPVGYNNIVCVGRVAREKNYEMLINAISIAKKKIDDLTLDIYGRYDENDWYFKKIQELVMNKNLQKIVNFCGQKDDIFEIVKNYNIFVLSSKSEGMPNSLLEAMCIGMPVIATDCPSGGPKNLIKNEHNGIIIKNNSVIEMAKAIEYLCKSNNIAKKLGMNAKLLYEDYKIENIGNAWIELFKTEILR